MAYVPSINILFLPPWVSIISTSQLSVVVSKLSLMVDCICRLSYSDNSVQAINDIRIGARSHAGSREVPKTSGCSEVAVSGISESRYDKSIGIKFFIDCSSYDRYIGMMIRDSFYSFPCLNYRNETDLTSSLIFEKSDRIICTTAGSQHRISQKNHRPAQISWKI